MFFQKRQYFICNVQLHCTIEVLENIFDTFGVDFGTIYNLFDGNNATIKKKIDKLIDLMCIEYSDMPAEKTDEYYACAIKVIFDCLRDSLPTDGDIPPVKQPDRKSKSAKKNNQPITIPYLIYIAVTVLGIEYNSVLQLTAKQIIQLYGQHLLYNLGADEVQSLDDMIPM